VTVNAAARVAPEKADFRPALLPRPFAGALPERRMAKRKGISKKTRFEIFKRDGFACQYCGATPPNAFLHVDHVIAVANGGHSGADNLVTACADCNLGKAARPLSVVPQSLADQAAEVAEREEQLRGYQDILEARRSRIASDVEAVCRTYERLEDGELTPRHRVSIKVFIEKLGVIRCIECMELACIRAKGDVFKYFCGICWSSIREQ
jgi:hypothetical protein